MSKASSIMVVDDDEDCRDSIKEVLEDEGCTVYTAENGKRALELLQTVKPDLILVDLMMPVMNGWDFCAELERDPRFSDLPVVILSAVGRFGPRGRERVLEKPVRLDTLLTLLDYVDAP